MTGTGVRAADGAGVGGGAGVVTCEVLAVGGAPATASTPQRAEREHDVHDPQYDGHGHPAHRQRIDLRRLGDAAQRRSLSSESAV